MTAQASITCVAWHPFYTLTREYLNQQPGQGVSTLSTTAITGAVIYSCSLNGLNKFRGQYYVMPTAKHGENCLQIFNINPLLLLKNT
jgi:hypothetical protein